MTEKNKQSSSSTYSESNSLTCSDESALASHPEFNHLPVVTYRYSLCDDKGCTFISNNVECVTGFTPEQFLNDEFWLSRLKPDEKNTVLKKIEEYIDNGHGQVQYRFMTDDDEFKLILDHFNVVTRYGKPVELVGNWLDMGNFTGQAAGSNEMTDKLTGLLNRTGMLNQLMLMNSTDFKNDDHVYCHVDIDNFTVVNTSCGQAGGDELLQRFAQLLKSKLSKRDLVARLHADNFAILLQHCNLEQAQRLFNTLQECMDEFRFQWGDNYHAVTASLGAIQINKSIRSIENVPGNAEAAASIAKKKGRNEIHIHEESDTAFSEHVDEMRWVERINRAMEEDRLHLYYQPIVSLQPENKNAHFEFLVRMKDPDGKLIPPGMFLPAAERYNLSVKLDFWVIQTALSWLEAYSDIMPDNVSWGINLSGQSLANKALKDFVIDQFNRKEVLHDKVYFEVTETAAINNLDNAIQFINALKHEGCKFALDDFGSGLSSFAYLQNLPVDYIKIDGIFIKNIIENKVDKAMVEAIKLISDAMGKETIAEFVENDAIKALLKDLGVDFAQGYGISKPIPLSEFEQHTL